MLSRLSGLANTVLQELSGEGEDAGARALPTGPELEPIQQHGEEMPEDTLERLAHMERLVVQLKDLVQEKEAHLQQKDALLQEERQAAEAKLTKLKLQAKAKMASLNKRIENLMEQGAALPLKDPLSEPLPSAKLQNDQETCDNQKEMEVLRSRLQEQEEMVGKLQEQLEVVTGSLKEAEVQLSYLQEEIQKKDSCLEEQACQHQAELQLVTKSVLEADMQQNLRLLHRKLEEQEAALLGRTQVAELLQQELNDVEEQNQILLEKLQQAEAELDSLRTSLSSERQESRSLVEKLELELAEQKLAFHRLQEEGQQLIQKQAQAREAQAHHQHKSLVEEVQKKDEQIAEFHQVEQDLRSSCDALQAENAWLRQNATHLKEQAVMSLSVQQGELPVWPAESNSSPTEPEILGAETAGQTSLPNEPTTDQETIFPMITDRQQGDNQHKTVGEILATENETFHPKLPMPEKRLELTVDPAKSNQAHCAEIGVDMQPPLAFEDPSDLGHSFSELGGLLDGLGSGKIEGPPVLDVPGVQSQFSPGRSPEELPDMNSQSDVLEYLSAKKHKDLSVLLLELQEAQEEIAFLKGQLQDSSSLAPDGAEQWSRKLQASDTKEGGETGMVLIQNHSSSGSLVTVEILEESPLLLAMPMEQDDPSAKDKGATQGPSPGSAAQTQGVAEWQLKIVELQASQQKTEELHQKALNEKAVEIKRLQQLVEDSDRTLHTLTTERDQLLSQLCSLTELKEQVRQLKGSLADAEKQRLSDYESEVSQLGALKEQIHSLQNEAKSKEMKIEALQKDLDEAQHCLAEQELLGKRLTSQIQEEKQGTRALMGQLEEATARSEKLSQSIVSKEQEMAELERLLAEKTAEIARLQQEVVKREQQVAEVSTGMSDRMVQLSEEKFLLGKELKSLQEQLSVLLRKKETTRDQGVGTEEEEQQTERASSPGKELEGLRKENEHMRKKLQAALVSRKELLSKVHKLEREVESGRGQPAKPGSKQSVEVWENEEEEVPPPECSGNFREHMTPEGAASLTQLLSSEETELKTVLGEKESMMTKMQAEIGELQQSLQEKDLLISSLQAELENCRSTPEKPAPENLGSEVCDTAHVAGSATDSHEALQRTALREKICALEQEKEQLQKKLQEALASRKDTVKKSQEKDRHHREQLKQQKDDYNLLQEQFERQSQEKESLQDQLLELQAQKESLENVSLPKTAEGALSEWTQPGLGHAQESGWEVSAGFQEGTAVTRGSIVLEEGSEVERFKVDHTKLQAEKEELEAQIGCLERELVSKSEATLHLQVHVGQLLAEMEVVKAACSQSEASLAGLRAEVARQESLRLQQMELAKQKELAHEEEMEVLRSQLVERNESLHSLQAELQEREKIVKALQGQLIQTQHPHAKLEETQQKAATGATENQSGAQLQRKLQAALISRKEVLRESKLLKEELAATKASLESAALHLSEAEGRASVLEEEKSVLLEKLASLREERAKLIAEVDRALVENQNVSGSCESLKLALEGVTQEKTRLEEEADALRCAQAKELSEQQEKHKELQKEYEALLQSYENVSNEAERIQRVVEGVRQEKQEFFLKLKGVEAEKKEVSARLQGAEQEMEAMREKMRKFAKSKQQKILELEEENERLRAEAPAAHGDKGSTEDLSTHLSKELENSRKTCESLSTQLQALMAEKDSLSREVQDLRQTLQSTVQQEVMAESKAVGPTRSVLPEAGGNRVDPGPDSEPLEAVTASVTTEMEEEHINKASPGHDEINGYVQHVAQLTAQVAELGEKRREAVEELGRIRRSLETLGEEKKDLEDLLASKDQELAAMQGKVTQVEQAHQQTEEQLVRAKGLQEALEAEKDDLEERLMNQLAELNGSIGNYQQDVADLQSKNQQLLKEVKSLHGTLQCLEDEKQHLMRERVEVKAEQKEHVGKLKSTWKGEDGRLQAKELQELLKEKQQEVRQLQKDCIKNQEKISSLERTIKALEFVQSESLKELEATKKSLAKAGDDTKKAQAELASCRVLLDDTQSEMARVLAESLKAKEELQANQEHVKAQLKQKEENLERLLDQEKGKHAKELRNLEEKLEALQRDQARSKGVVQELQASLRQKDQEAKQLQGSLNHTLAQLVAFTRSMSSLQDDRDRVIDESRQWEEKFTEAIEKKEQEVQAREKVCAVLEEQAKQMAAQVEDLQSCITSLEQKKLAQESSSQKELQHYQEETKLLQEENKRCAFQLEEVQQLFSDSQNQVQKQETELQSLREQLTSLQDSLAKCKEAREDMESRVKHQEASLQECRFSCEQLETDLQVFKELTDRLQEEISSKDQKIISLLTVKEEAVSAAVSELLQQHKEELKELENRIGKGEEERASLENERKKALEKVSHLVGKLKSTREESKQYKAQLDSFTKSMSSLQDDRDRVLEDYQQLEQRHLAAILEKDQLIQEAAAENNTLKEELRSLNCQMDDLHAENAKLDAELVRYREDLNQLISIKDCQQKQLLKTQLERIQALEKERAGVEGQLRDSECALGDLRLSMEALQQEKHSMGQEMKTLTASLSQLKGDMAALQEGGPMLELQVQLQGQADKVQELTNQLSLAQQRVAELEDELALVQKTMAQKMHEAEAKMKKELKNLHHDAGLMRNETETAEERVAELARDLLEMEQNLLAITEENQDLKAQIQSFGKAMSSLQDSWDQSNEELHTLEKKYSVDMEEQHLLVQRLQEENAQLQEQQKHLADERGALASELGALQNSLEGKSLLARLEKFNQQLQAKDMELFHLASELEEASGQVKSFSKAMVSLQDERDRLLSELDKTRKVAEVKLQSTSPAEVKSLKKALSSLQNDRDRLVVELKNLQQQYLQVGVDTAEIMRLQAQLQEQKQETEQQQHLQEQLKQELQQLREAMSVKEQQLRHLPRAVQETEPSAQVTEEDQCQRQVPPETTALKREAETANLQAQLRGSLKELHQKELRIQQLNSKLSQVFEEKNSLSLQLRGSSRNLRESHQRYSEVLTRCEVLEKQLQELQPPVKDTGSHSTDAAPGAPQERSEHPRESYTPELQELQIKLSEAKQQQSNARQGLLQLEELLREEQDRRLVAEEAFAAAQDHIRRLESSEWSHPLDTSIDMSPSPEHAPLVGPTDGSFSKARGSKGLQNVLRLLFSSRTRLPLLVMAYLFTIHVLLVLCFTGHL